MKTNLRNLLALLSVSLWASVSCDPPIEVETGDPVGAVRADTLEPDAPIWEAEPDVFDDFERADDVSLGRTPVGGYPWVGSRQTGPRLVSGAMRHRGSAGARSHTSLEDWSADDFLLSVQVQTTDESTSWGLSYGLSDEAGYTLEAVGGTMSLRAGARTLGELDVALETAFRLQVAVQGELHRVWIDGVPVLDVVDAEGTASGGVALSGSEGATFDELWILGDPAPADSGDSGGAGGGAGGPAGSLASPGGDGGGASVVPGGDDPITFGGGGGGGGSGGGSGGGGGAFGDPDFVDDPFRNLGAPSPDLTVPTTLYKEVGFLYEGANPEQADADLSVLEPSRIAHVYGWVRDAWGQPLADVQVEALGHPELGWTTTRADGSYDMVVTGGVSHSIVLSAPGLLTVHRKVETIRGDSHRADDAVMLGLDPEASLITFDEPIEVHHAFTLNDGLPDRMATVMFQQDTQATMVFADESRQLLPEMTVRLTEYTVGDDGPKRMPSPLPSGTAYNYAIEISADEAEAEAAVSVELDKPAVLYVDNFLDWPVGVVVPSGSYDRMVGRWIPEPDGRVVEIVGFGLGGIANLDIDGDGMADSATDLGKLGITTDERVELGSIYTLGAQLWRTPIDHFTPYDLNPSQAPGEGPPDGLRPDENEGVDDCETGGSIIGIDTQDLGESLPIAGTPFSLEYRSSRTLGAPNRSLRIRTTGDDVPSGLVATAVVGVVAGRAIYGFGGNQPNSYAELFWDGLDAFGRPVQGPQPISLCVGWGFPDPGSDVALITGTSGGGGGGSGSGSASSGFGSYPQGASGTHLPGSGGVIYYMKCYGNNKTVAAANADAITKADRFRLGGLDARTASDRLGGWTLNVHHTLARSSGTLYRGDGTERELADEALWTAQRFAGNRSSGSLEGPATGVPFDQPTAVAADAAGNIYVGTSGLVRRIDTSGNAEIVAGFAQDLDGVAGAESVSVGFFGDGGPATSAWLNTNIAGLAVDGEGGIYIADADNHRVRYVDPDGVISTVAGSGSANLNDVYQGVTETGGDPLAVSLFSLEDIALTPEGLLISQSVGLTGAVRLLTADGGLIHIAGTPAPDHINQATMLPSELCPGDGTCSGASGTISPPGPYDTIDDLGEFMNGPHEVRAEWASLSGQYSLTANDSDIFLAEGNGSGSGRVRRISGLRGGNIYGFRKDYLVQEPLPCNSVACTFPVQTDISDIIRAVDAEDSALLYATHGELYRAPDDLEIPAERIVGGPLADTLMDVDDDIILGNRLQMALVTDLIRGPDGAIYVADHNRDLVYRIARIVPPMYVSSWVTSEDGTEVFLFDDEGRHLETRDARTHALVWSFGYDGEGRLTGVTDRFGDTTTIVRDGSGQAVQIVSPFPDSITTTLGHDGDGYLDTVTDPEGALVEFGYLSGGLLDWMTDSDSASDFGYDNDGRLTNDDAEILYQGQSEGDVNQVLFRTVSDETTVEVRHTSAEGLDTFYARTRTGPSAIEREARFPDGTVTEGYRTPEEEQATHADGTVVTARYTFDSRLGPNTRVPEEVVVSTPGPGVAGDSVTTFGRSYVPYCTTPATQEDEGFDEGCDPLDPQVDPDLQADVITDTIIRGNDTWRETYRRAHLESGVSVPASVTLTTPMERESVTTLNGDGQVDTVSIPGRAPSTFGYDPRGRLLSVTQVDGTETRSTSYTYNAAGFVATVTDALARTTSYEYDAVGRVTRQYYPDGRFVDFDYDEDGNLVSVTPPGRPAHTMQHDSLDRTREVGPPALTVVPDPETEFEYDEEHRPTTVTRPDAQVMTLSYDPTTGKLDTVTTPTGNYVYSYDAMTGKVDVVTDPYGGSLDVDYYGYLPASETWSGTVAGSVSWTYDDRHRVISESVNGGETITVAYDADGNVEVVGALDLILDPANGELVGTTLDSITTTHDANAFGEPTAITYENNATPLYEVTFERDAVGRIHTKTEVRDFGGGPETIVRCYEYDLVGRLADVYDAADSNGCTGSLVEHYGYDSNGNRDEVTNSGTYLASGDIAVDEQDRLLDYGPVSFTYTANGEVDTRIEAANTTNYEYDVSGNLVHVELSNGTEIDYAYDARGRRIRKEVDGVVEYGLLYGDQLNPVAQLDGMGNIQWRFVYGTRPNVPDYMVAASGGGTVYRFVTDHLGSVVAVVNAFTGVAVQELRYDSFGRVEMDTAEGYQPFGFAGGIQDPHTEWVLFGARDYRPEVGAWAAPDPTGFGGSDANLYRYVFADPVNLVDPMGESAVEFVAAIGDDMLAGIGLDGHAIRKNLGIADVVDVCSSDYALGGYAALAVDLISGAGALRGGLKLLRRACFGAGTVVETADGPRPIEEIEVGDLVWSRDEETGEEGWQPVTRVFATPEREVLELTLEDERGAIHPIAVTPDHPLWSRDDGAWRRADELRLGARVDALNGSVVVVAANSLPGKHTVFNLEVADSHTYFAGEDGLWAHNTCKKTITLYRGIGDRHTRQQLADAHRGRAVPRGGTRTPAEHNLGDTDSPYTSWTTDHRMARKHSTGENGVVLKAEVPVSMTVRSPDIYKEGEVLVQGIVDWAEIMF